MSRLHTITACDKSAAEQFAPWAITPEMLRQRVEEDARWFAERHAELEAMREAVEGETA